MHARFFALTLVALPALLLAACGGAGADPGDDAPTTLLAPPLLEGVILDVDGETALVEGIGFTLAESGEEAVSDPSGAFTFLEVPEGEVTVALGAGITLYAPGSAGEAPGFGNEAPGSAADVRDRRRDEDDENDRRDNQVHIRDVRRGERIRLEMRIENGRITDARVLREGDDPGGGVKRELEIDLWRTDANTDPDMEGELELSIDSAGCQEFEIEVEDATVNMVLEAVVIDPDGNEESLGFLYVEPDGDAEWRLDTSKGDDLPLQVDSLLELEFHGVEVRDQQGVALMRGRIPELPPYDHCFRIRGAARLKSLAEPVGGYVAYKIVGCTGEWLRQRFEIGAHHLRRGQEVEFFLEDPAIPGQLVSIGTVIANQHGIARLMFHTAHGDDLPHNVDTIRQLIGLKIQVRDDVTGRRLLVGYVPEPLED